MRIRLHEEHRQPGVLGQFEQGLRERPEIASVSTNTRTGSVLVQYDRHGLSRDDVLAIFHDIGLIVQDIAGAETIGDEAEQRPVGAGAVVGHSTAAVTVMDALTDLDRRLSVLTGGKLDVKLLFPLSLGALALRQIATTGLGLAEVPGYVLLWYAFDSFYKLHQRQTARLVEAALAEPTPPYEDPDTSADDVMLVDETGD